MAAALVPLAVLAAAEGGLRLFRCGYPTNFFVKTDGGAHYTVNEDFARQFYSGRAAAGKSHPFLMAARKPPGTTRIFILGESAALGTPEPSFGFGRILEFMLRKQHPGQRFEVINAAMRGVNSHIILRIAQDCARHEPDLVIVYVGNNELVGLHAPEPGSGVLRQNLAFIRAVQWARSLRLGQWLATALENATRKASPQQDMDFFRARRIAFDDPRRAAVCRNFRVNLEEMCQVISRSGAKAALCTIAVNLKDFPPFGSLHRPDLTSAETGQWETAYAEGIAAESRGQHEAAIGRYLMASHLDDHFAELQFRLGRCYEAGGTLENARKHYGLARDWDALPFRADSRINDLIRDVAVQQRQAGVILVDAERAFAESELTSRRIPGADLFHDHVHFRFDGDYLLARALYPVVVSALGKSPDPGPPLPSRQECAAGLAFTMWDELQIDGSLVAGMAFPPYLDQLDHAQRLSQADQAIKTRRQSLTRADLEQAVATYVAALGRAPDDWQLHHNFGKFCFAMGNFKTAAEHLAFEVKLFPDRLSSRMAYGFALLRAGRNDEAVTQFTDALRIDPQYEPARKALTAVPAGATQREP